MCHLYVYLSQTYELTPRFKHMTFLLSPLNKMIKGFGRFGLSNKTFFRFHSRRCCKKLKEKPGGIVDCVIETIWKRQKKNNFTLASNNDTEFGTYMSSSVRCLPRHVQYTSRATIH